MVSSVSLPLSSLIRKEVIQTKVDASLLKILDLVQQFFGFHAVSPSAEFRGKKGLELIIASAWSLSVPIGLLLGLN